MPGSASANSIPCSKQYKGVSGSSAGKSLSKAKVSVYGGLRWPEAR